MKQTIVYVHGFNSGPGEKAEELQKQFPNCEVIAPQLPYNPALVVKIIGEILNERLNEEVHIVGTSLGAFYILYLSTMYKSKDNFIYYLINPSFRPQETLQKYYGKTVTNFKTGEEFIPNSDFYVLLISQYYYILAEYDADCIHSSNYFLASHDEVLDLYPFMNFIQKFELPVRMYFSDQDHRHENISTVVDKIKCNMVG